MRKLITIILIFVCSKSFAQVYQLMPQYGYQANRFVFDSTLQIPTTCGVPTLKSVQFVTKRAAIAFDSCNNTFYQYNPKTLAWSVVSGGGGSTDTTSLSNRINLKIDSVKRRLDSVFGYRNGTEVFQFKDSIGGSVANDTAKVVIAKVYNATGTTLQRGEVVYLFGANGDVASVKRASNKDDSTSSKTFGLVRRNIASGDTGYITTQGQIEKLNLGSFTAGDVLWLDSIDGGFTKVKPQAPYHAVFLGVVERANNGNGLAYIKPQNGVEVDEIHDILINNVANNQILIYSDTLKVWKNRSVYTIVDTTSLSSRINQKLSISDTATMLNNYLTSADTISLSNRINLKYNTADTNLLQQKSLPANSIVGNATYQTANAQSIYFKDTSGTYTGTITWNGTAPTSGTFTYRWVRLGNKVDLNITLVYTAAGTSNSTLLLTLPSDAPTPVPPTGLTANSVYVYPVLAKVNAGSTTLTNAGERAAMRKNSGGTGFEINVNFTAQSAAIAYIQTTYYTN